MKPGGVRCDGEAGQGAETAVRGLDLVHHLDVRFDDFGGNAAEARKTAEVLVPSFFRQAAYALQPMALHRRTFRSGSNPQMGALAAWEARVCILADRQRPPSAFDPATVTPDWLNGLVRLSPYDDGVARARRYLFDAGIALVLEPHLPGTLLDGAAMRDLLAFQLAIERGQPGSVMCAYNRVNDVYACENRVLLNDVLKRDWGYKGLVMSDWGAVHSTEALLNGLDQQSGEQLDREPYFGRLLTEAVAGGDARYAARVDDAAHRIVRTMIATGMFDDQPQPGGVIDFDAHAQIARRVAERGVVLLKNDRDLLPLARAARSIVVIGDQADVGVLSGGGSSQVAGPGGPAATVRIGGENAMGPFSNALYHGSSPLAAIKAEAPDATVRFAHGRYISEAVDLASKADLAIVFVGQWTTEASDVPDLSLPGNQEVLIEAVARANPNTVVVLQTGGPVVMPWLDRVPAVLEAWYSGARGGEAIADILFGDVNPSGRLPVTFPASVDQLPRPAIPGIDQPSTGLVAMGQARPSFPVDYTIEGSDVGYRWFEAKGERPLFPFGFGLSYTEFDYSDLKVDGGDTLTVSFKVTNTGRRAGVDVPQVYLTDSPGRSQQRLIGFEPVSLAPGESRTVSLTVDRRLLGNWDTQRPGWSVPVGDYKVFVGKDAASPRLNGQARLRASRLRP